MVDEPKGSLDIFGTQQQIHESDCSLDKIEHAYHNETMEDEGGPYDREAEAYERENEEPYQSGPPVVDDAVEEEAEAYDEEEEGLDEFDLQLRRVRQQDPPQEVQQPDPQQLDARLAYQQGRLEALEAEIQRRAQATVQQVQETQEAPAPKRKGSGINYQDPAVQAALREAMEDPAKMGPTIAILARKEAEAILGDEVGEVRQTLAELQRKEQEAHQRQEASAGITAGLQAAYQLGGLEAAIVKEAWNNQENSMLFQYLSNGNQALATTPQGIMTAVLAVARAVEKVDANNQTEPTRRAPAPVSSKKRSTKASSRGRDMRKPTKATPEDTEKGRIVGAKTARSAIPFLK